MKTVLILFIAIISLQNAFGTAQIPDKIKYNDMDYSLFSNPLETYFEKYPDLRPKGGWQSTALWRGYKASFEISRDILYLRDIEINVRDTDSKKRYASKWISVLNDVFPDQKDIVVDWLTGLLVLPSGELLEYVHMGYASTYENYLLLEIDKGILIKEIQFTGEEYEEFKDKQYQAFKQTDEYQEIKAELLKDGNTEEFIDDFLKIYVIEYSSKILIE
ncbi:MAG: hypothetical protein M9949_14470 [Candidatus Kapabacteria bacterium]|nr:hypothetical protein [Candidatus Kapabacteria bacterium]